MTETYVEPEPAAGPPWLKPRTLPGSVALFVAGYLIVQPLVAGVFFPLLGEGSFGPPELWRSFLLWLIPLGAVAGTLWWIGGQLSPGWIRYWVRGTSRMIAFTTMIQVKPFGQVSPARWIAVILVTAVFMGALFGWLERWDRDRVSSRGA